MLKNKILLLALLVAFTTSCVENTGSPGPDREPSGTQTARTRVEEKDQVSIDNMNPEMPWNSRYRLGPDSLLQDGVARGEVIKHHFVSQAIYPGVERDYWLYVPKQYDAGTPACLMVFQDGEMYLSPEINVPAVLDNLIHKKDIPVMIGLFVNPGDRGPGTPVMGGDNNRSNEYNSLGDRYARGPLYFYHGLLEYRDYDHTLVFGEGGHSIQHGASIFPDTLRWLWRDYPGSSR